MEVLEGIESSPAIDDFLRDKIYKAVERVKRSLELYGNTMAFSFNGGKDSTVLLHIIRAAVASLYGDSDQAQGMAGVRSFFFSRQDDFPEVDAFVHDMAQQYNLGLQVFDGDFQSELESFIQRSGVKAIVLGTRRGDPNAGGQEVWCPSSPGWPAFMRINPIMDWAYRDVWAFLQALRLPYCTLYDQGYTSLGSTKNTVQNSALQRTDGSYAPAYELMDGRLERAGRVSKLASCSSREGLRSGTAALAIIGDEMLSGKVEDANGHFLCQQLHALGWRVARLQMLPDDVATISKELRSMSKTADVVLTAGGVGPTLDDVTMAAVADALSVLLVRNLDLEQRIRKYFGDNVTEAHLKMADAPEGACELIDYTLDTGRQSPFPLVLCSNIYVLPGVPHLLRQKWKAVRQHLQSHASCAPFRSVALRLAVVDEACVAPLLDDLAAKVGSGVAIGSYPVSEQDDAARLVVSLESKDVQQLQSARALLLGQLAPGVVTAEDWDAPAINRTASQPDKQVQALGAAAIGAGAAPNRH